MAGLRIAGHSAHAMAVHYPMALLGVALLWDAAACLRPETTWPLLAFWSIAAGLAAAMPAAVTGFLDYLALPTNGARGRLGLFHMVLMLCGVSAFGWSFLVRFRAPESAGALACDAVGFILLASGAWFGGELVFGHGVGMRPGVQLPETEQRHRDM